MAKSVGFDFSDLTKNLTKDMELTEQQHVALVKKTVLDVHADLVRATPVDTGHARQGWVATLPQAFGEEGGITNDVPYIEPLNNGHSKQAPAKFIEAVVEKYTKGGA